MEIRITKISDEAHAVQVNRRDASSEQIELNSRSFLRHDFAHFAVEHEIPLRAGYWGSVANGAALGGEIESPEIWLAESLAGPVQTLIRKDSPVARYLEVLERVVPDRATSDLAERIYNCGRRLTGHWRATPYGEFMIIHWAP